ncbi:MAG: hypothetical protein AVDCRST_MAG60-345, partial [uncultured Nocardioides sp.]
DVVALVEAVPLDLELATGVRRVVGDAVGLAVRRDLDGPVVAGRVGGRTTRVGTRVRGLGRLRRLRTLVVVAGSLVRGLGGLGGLRGLGRLGRLGGLGRLGRLGGLRALVVVAGALVRGLGGLGRLL